MSDFAPLSSFSTAVTKTVVEAATATYPSDYVIEHILKLSSYLIDLVDNSKLFGRSDDDLYSASLRTLYSRLQNKQLGPSTLPPGFLSEERIHARIYVRTDEAAADRPLADFEDIYYALAARMQEMHQLLNLRIDSGFNMASHVVFEGGPRIADLHSSLSEYWGILNDPACGKALDDAIRAAKVQALRDEIIWQVENNQLSPGEAHEQLAQLYSTEVYNGIVGLNFVQDWAPTMIGAYLEQKYRVVLGLEKQEAAIKARQERRLARMKNKRTTIIGAPESIAGRRRSRHGRRSRKNSQENMRSVVNRRSQQHSRKQSQDMLTEVDQQDQQQQRQSDHDIHITPQQVNKGTPLKVNHVKKHQHQQAYLAYEAVQHEAKSNDNLEQERAHQNNLHKTLEWQMKTQRVSEYSNYLRARASQSARYVVQGTFNEDSTGQEDDSSFGGFKADLSEYMEF
jgi:hypothetical protein